MKVIKSFLTATLITGFFALPSFAKPSIKMVLSQKKIVKISDKREKLVDFKKVLPGEVIVYTLNAKNNGDESAAGFAPQANIPEGTIYIPEKNNSNDYDLLFSIDQGKTFSKTPMIKVLQGGKEITKKAPIEMYNKIKWSIKDDVKPGNEIRLTYKVIVKK